MVCADVHVRVCLLTAHACIMYEHAFMHTCTLHMHFMSTCMPNIVRNNANFVHTYVMYIMKKKKKKNLFMYISIYE